MAYSSTRLHHTIQNALSTLIASGTSGDYKYTGQIVGATYTTATYGWASRFKITSPPGTKFVYKQTIYKSTYPTSYTYNVSF